MKEQIFTVTYPWDNNGYKPYAEYRLSVCEDSFLMQITVEEHNPRRVQTRHQQDVYKDSCVEWFVNFLPDSCDRYFNFEVNASGIMHVAFRRGRHDGTLLTEEAIRQLNIQATVGEDTWQVCFRVPFSWIQSYIPEFQFREGMKIRTNFYKCGDETQFPHYGIWKESPLEKPDFHRPEYFGEVTL